ncbi:hypothetical protein FRC06_001424, partial [Ceratobasidium sp. 370]
MAEKTVECLERLGVKHLIQSICLDNASNNNTFVRSIARFLPRFAGDKARSRCLAHIANLVAKAFLEPYTRPSSRKRRIMDSSEATTAPTPSSAATSPDISANLNEPDGILDDLNGVLDADEGRELFDQAEVK